MRLRVAKKVFAKAWPCPARMGTFDKALAIMWRRVFGRARRTGAIREIVARIEP